MSRLGKIPVSVPKGVEVKIDGQQVGAKGPKGELALRLHAGISARLEDGLISLTPAEGREKQLSPFHGLDRALVQNLVTGVSAGFEKTLEIEGTGYQAKLNGNKIELQIGFANLRVVPIPKELDVEVPSPTRIIVRGIDRQKVGHFAAVVRKVRPPEPYKGKGIRYSDEVVRRKAGKTTGA
ncbi:MAG: 50S ribosomal protein L6 [Planctomycetota bacterium]|nr:MAG: 50S ribosomal protein L6 [Planctomycetota bacterium]